jgi:small subunit ribosomal protein S9
MTKSKKISDKKITKKKKKPAASRPKLKNLDGKQAASPKKDGKYHEAIGRRKSASARVRLFTSGPLQSAMEGNIVVNDKPYKEYFPTLELQRIVDAPLVRLKSLNRFRATAKVKGGGIRGQAEAVRHGLSRTLVLFDFNFRKKLKKSGYLTRDSRVKERRKFGLKKARRAPQWTKR